MAPFTFKIGYIAWNCVTVGRFVQSIWFKKITCFMKRWRTSMGFQLWKTLQWRVQDFPKERRHYQPFLPFFFQKPHWCFSIHETYQTYLLCLRAILLFHVWFILSAFCHTIVVVHWNVRNHTNQKEGFCYSTNVCWVRRQVCMIYLIADTLSSFPTEYIKFFLNPLFCFAENICLKWLYYVLYFRYKLLAKTKNCPPNAESCRNILAFAKITGWHIG